MQNNLKNDGTEALDDPIRILKEIAKPSMFWTPQYYHPKSAWLEHLPFAFWLVDVLRPKVIVELGTHWGPSYFGLCQAVQRLSLGAKCYAVDTWEGDKHAGQYSEEVFQTVDSHNRKNFADFSTLIRSTFDDAAARIDEEIDLLHIDGLHTFEAVKHDFETWRPKLSERAVVLLHDTNIHHGDFGVYPFFLELKERYPTFDFLHCAGLGVVGVGPSQADTLQLLYRAASDAQATGYIRCAFERLGHSWLQEEKFTGAQLKLLAAERREKSREELLSESLKQIKDVEAKLQAAEKRAKSKEDLATEQSKKIGDLSQHLEADKAHVAGLQRQIHEFTSSKPKIVAELGRLQSQLAEARRKPLKGLRRKLTAKTLFALSKADGLISPRRREKMLRSAQKRDPRRHEIETLQALVDIAFATPASVPGAATMQTEEALDSAQVRASPCPPVAEPIRRSASDKLRVIWVVNGHDKMTMHYRVHNYSKALADAVSYDVVDEKSLSPDHVQDADILVLCRIPATASILDAISTIQKNGGVAVFDIDDFVFDKNYLLSIRHIADRSDAQREAFMGFMDGLKETLQHCDFATTSTYFLKQEIERMGKRAFVVPNSIGEEDFARRHALLKLKDPADRGRLRIGYFSGTKSHNIDFMECKSAVHELMRQRDDVDLVVVGHLDDLEEFEIYGERLIRKPFMAHADMLDCLATVDINLAPLEWRNSFVHGKSELKIFEAALFDVPTIASPSSGYAAVIENRVNGYLARDDEEWLAALSELAGDAKLRADMGARAFETIAKRFHISETKNELMAVLKAASEGTDRRLPVRSVEVPATGQPAISIISILFKKAHEVTYFLESMRRQSFHLPYEIVLVDDASPDNSVEVVERFISDRLVLPDSNRMMSVRIVSQATNGGNCTSRNIGLQNSSADIVVVVDADCLFNGDFLMSHYNIHAKGAVDVAIGPKGIETEGRPAMSVLAIHDATPALAEGAARPQDPFNPDSFVNTVTRNFSIKRKVIEDLLGHDFFDELFNYSLSPTSGFGWEDIELGCRLYEAGARFHFLPDTASIHLSHPPTVENADKPLRSLRNFRRLHEKHPELHLTAELWTQKTYEAITKWCRAVGEDLNKNEDFCALERHFGGVKSFSVASARQKKLRILSYRWHCPHQYELYKLGHDVTLVKGLGSGLCEEWDWAKRPLPRNAQMLHADEVDPRDYDVALLHFDENVLRPDACLGAVPADWGKAFQSALEWDLPKIAICHGTPQFRGQYDATYDQPDLGMVDEESRLELVNLLQNTMVVCNSHQAREEWKFHQCTTIWHGFSPHDFPPNMRGTGAFRMGQNALDNRPHYNGLFIMQHLAEAIGDAKMIATLEVPDPPVTYAPRTEEWAQAKYQNYVREIGRHAIYVNPTVRSPMPRTRGECMMAGLATVSLRNHDVDMFIENGVNGFFADTAEEMADQVRFLIDNPETCELIRSASRKTALELFNQSRYLNDWAALLERVVGRTT